MFAKIVITRHDRPVARVMREGELPAVIDHDAAAIAFNSTAAAPVFSSRRDTFVVPGMGGDAAFQQVEQELDIKELDLATPSSFAVCAAQRL